MQMRGVYLKRGNRTFYERAMESAVSNFLKRKFVEDPAFEFEPLRNISELRDFYQLHCSDEKKIPDTTKEPAIANDDLVQVETKTVTNRPMKNIPFVLWMIFFPVSSCVFNYVNWQLNHTEIIFFGNEYIILILQLILYFFVAYVLYE